MKQTSQMLERAVRKIRQRIFDLPEHKQDSASQAIATLKARINYPDTRRKGPSGEAYHPFYACE